MLRGLTESSGTRAGARPPLVVVPGLPGSALEFKATENSFSPESGCTVPANKWLPLYPPDASVLLVNCYVSAMRVDFNKTTKTFVPACPGLKVRTVGFGGFSGILDLDDGNFLPYAEREGWKLNESLFGAPFDWRLPAIALTGYFEELKALIEHAVSSNGGSKAVLFSLSLGAPVALGFLHRQPESWLDSHVAGFVVVSPMWSGIPFAYLQFLSGAEPGANGSKFENEVAAIIAQGAPTTLWMFPRPGAGDPYTWNHSDALVITPSRNYTAFDNTALLENVGGFAAAQIDALDFLSANGKDLTVFSAPKVDVVIVYGNGIPTVGQLNFTTDFEGYDGPITPKSVGFDNGDGLVPERSALRSITWKAAQHSAGKQLIHRGFEGLRHARCLSPSHFQNSSECCSFLLSWIGNLSSAAGPLQNVSLLAEP